MKSYLSKLEPPGRSDCLCGSGVRFKNCCKKKYSKKHFDGWKKFNQGNYKEALKSIRSHITWYKLCHLAHTVPFLRSDTDESKSLLNTDIEALSEMTGLLLSCYEKCNIIDAFPAVLERLGDSINDAGWKLKIDYHKCVYLYIYKNNSEATFQILKKYEWNCLNDVDLLTLYLDAKSDDLNQVEKINISKKIFNLTSSLSLKLQYGNLLGIQYCLLNDLEKGVPIIKKSIRDYEEVSKESRSLIGRHYLSLSYKHLGEITGNDKHIIKAAELLEYELMDEEYSKLGCSQLWFDLGDCYYHLKEFEKSLKAYNKSLELNQSDLVIIFKARVLIELKETDKAKALLDDVKNEQLSNSNYFDYAISRCYLAFQSLNLSDIDEGLDLIKRITTKDPLFKDVAQKLLIQLYEIKSTNKNTPEAESALKKFNRYVSLKPNMFGIGIDINAIIDDIVQK
jgi:tetratricopeptide (TPR) repeat protein